MITVVLKGWPRLSETFIARELVALEARGLDLDVWSLRHPTDTLTHPIHTRLKAKVHYLPEYLHQEPRRVFRAWRRWRWTPGYAMAKGLFNADWRRDRSRNRIRRFGQAMVLAAEMVPQTRAFYAHFAHTPGSVARYAAALTGLPFAMSAHARDIWTTPDWDLKEKLAAARFTTTCSTDGAARLCDLGGQVKLNPHGLDLTDWPVPPPRPSRDGSNPADPVTILTVGRLVEKKGHDVLLDALARIPGPVHWRLVQIGGGPLKKMLQDKAAALGLADRIDWRGAQDENAVREAMRSADLFTLTPRVAKDGDRDGIPNVLLEAQSQGLALVTTSAGGIGQLVSDGVNGLVAPTENAAAIAAALERLIVCPALRDQMGSAGRARVETQFAADPGADAIVQLLREAMA